MLMNLTVGVILGCSRLFESFHSSDQCRGLLVLSRTQNRQFVALMSIQSAGNSFHQLANLMCAQANSVFHYQFDVCFNSLDLYYWGFNFRTVIKPHIHGGPKTWIVCRLDKFATVSGV